MSELMVEALSAGDSQKAYRAVLQLSDDLGSASAAELERLVAEPPRPLPSRWGAFVAAVVEWRGLQAGIAPPNWVEQSLDLNADAWSPPGAVLDARDEYVPWSFRKRNIRIEAGELGSA